MKDIHMTKKATRSISMALKFFLLKKKYYLTMLKIKPEIYQNSEFIRKLKSIPEDSFNDLSSKNEYNNQVSMD
jgi:hypothetical protein